MESQKTKSSRRKYDATFKQDVLKLIEAGRSVPDVAGSLGVSSSLVYRWVKGAAVLDPAIHKDNPALVFDPEKLALQKRIRDLEMEREILKKALGIFSRPIQ